MNLFSVTAHAGSALAAALVQPSAAGLAAIAAASLENPASEAYRSGDLLGERPHGPGGQIKRRGVVFEYLDSRIHMDSLVSAMGRLGLGVKCRSRRGRGIVCTPRTAVVVLSVFPWASWSAGRCCCGSRGNLLLWCFCLPQFGVGEVVGSRRLASCVSVLSERLLVSVRVPHTRSFFFGNLGTAALFFCRYVFAGENGIGLFPGSSTASASKALKTSGMWTGPSVIDQ